MVPFCIGIFVGILGNLIAWYIIHFKASSNPDMYDGALWLLVIFGLPTSLLYFPLSLSNLISSALADEITVGILFLINWCIVGYLAGQFLAFVFKREN